MNTEGLFSEFRSVYMCLLEWTVCVYSSMIYVGPPVFIYLCTYITSAQDPKVLSHQPDEHTEAGMCFLLMPVSNGGTHSSGDPRGGGPHQQLHPALLSELNVCPLSGFRPSWSLSLDSQEPAKCETAPIFTSLIFIASYSRYESQNTFSQCCSYDFTGVWC